MKPMVCQRCGNSISDTAAKCPHCGAPIAKKVSLSAARGPAPAAAGKKKKKKLSSEELGLRIALISVSVLAVLAILMGVLYLIGKGILDDNLNQDEKFSQSEQADMDVNPDLPTKDILNIALFGLDERGETGETYDEAGKAKSFHSDAIIILTVDRRDPANPTVKMSSIARDTLVYVEGYNSKGSLTKLTHAFQYGYSKAKSADKADGKQDLTEADYKREGAKTAIKTINANFHMNITEYVYVNFVEFMDIIDYVGGVTVNVEQRELSELNKHVRAMEKECGRDLDTVTKAGKQTLSGGQALAYARIRKIDSDLKRTNRQRTVLEALFDEVKSTPINQMADVVGKILSMCHTTLTSEEVLQMGVWAVTNSPEILSYTLPDTGVKAYWIWEGTHPNYAWVWIYDLEYASALLHDFIYDTDKVADMPLPTMPDEPKVTAAPSDTTTGIGDTTTGTGDTTTGTGDTTTGMGDTTTGTGDTTTGIGDTTTGTGDTTTGIGDTPTGTGDTTTGTGGTTTAPVVTVPTLPTGTTTTAPAVP